MKRARTEEQQPSPKRRSRRIHDTDPAIATPSVQKALLLHAVKQPYELTTEHPVPEIENDDEVLVKTNYIGLNPIDWKAPDFGFGIPSLPHISGRELVGEIVSLPKTSTKTKRRFNLRDSALVISTDYRDPRKAAYQSYVVASTSNIALLPPVLPSATSDPLVTSPPPPTTHLAAAGLGVAFISSLLALGICLSLSFTSLGGPDLSSILSSIPLDAIPADVRAEVESAIARARPNQSQGPSGRPQKGDWLAIWGGSSSTAFVLNQIARLAGLRTILVLDHAKHSALLSSDAAYAADVVVDAHNPARAIEIIRSVTQGKLRFGVDVVGKTTAGYLFSALAKEDGEKADATDETLPSPSSSSAASDAAPVSSKQISHLVGFTGLPKGAAPSGVQYHSVPVKIFHEVPAVGEATVVWLERLLKESKVVAPRVLGVVEGLEGVNEGLDRMRRGEISAGRLIARVKE